MRPFALLLTVPLAFAAVVAAPAPARAQVDAQADAPPRWTLTGELRFRGEALHELDFDDSVDHPVFDDERIFSRARLKVDARASDSVSLVIELMDSRIFGAEPGTASNSPSIGMHQGYLAVHQIGGTAIDVKVGRQELSYGDERLVGAFGWSNTARAFDAVVARLAPEGGVTFDLFGARLHDARIATDALGDDFAGAYLSWKGASLTADGYLFYLHDKGGQIDTDGDGTPDTDRFPGGGRLHLATVGGRVDGSLGVVGINAEAAGQLGKRGDLDVLAAAAHADLSYAIDAPAKPTIIVGGAYATGDGDPTDDSFGTFENLFPTNHLFYGYADIAAWKNLIEGFGKLKLSPASGWTTIAAVHALARASTDDAFYRAAGVPYGPGGASDARYVGTDIDLLAKWKAPNGLGFLAGVSYVVPGAYLDGPNQAAPIFAYLQMLGRF